jgi:hypothetical protein
MTRLLFPAGLLASLITGFGGARASAQDLDPGQAPAAHVQEASPTPVADAVAPTPAPTSPAPAETAAPAPAARDLDAQVAAAMAAIQNEQTGDVAASVEEHNRLNLYGFADFTYSRFLDLAADGGASYFMVGNLNLYLASELGDNWRSLIEVRFMYLPNSGMSPQQGGVGPMTDTTVLDSSDFGRPIQWGGIHIERAWLERTFHKLLTVRVGHWLTPYGIWNVDHGTPVVVSVHRPFIIGEQLFPGSQTGIEAYGVADIQNLQLGYHLTLSNGRGPISTMGDFDSNKAVGGRLFLRHESSFGTVTLGGSFYYGRYTNLHTAVGTDANGAPAVTAVIDSQYDELSLSADLKWQWHGLLVQGEFVEHEVAFVNGGRTVSTVPGAGPAFDSDYRAWGIYGLAGYRFDFLGLMPFAGIDDYHEGSPSWIPRVWAYFFGLNVRATPRVVLKLQYLQVHFPSGGLVPNWRWIAAKQRGVSKMRASTVKLLASLVGLSTCLINAGSIRSASAESPVPLAVVVAANSPLTNFSTYDLKHLYLGEFVTGPDGKRLIPLNLSAQSRDRVAFDASVLGMTPDQGSAYWIDRRIRGQSGSPRAVDSIDLAQRIVARLDGAVAYVPISAVRADVKVVRVDGKLPTDPTYHIR